MFQLVTSPLALAVVLFGCAEQQPVTDPAGSPTAQSDDRKNDDSKSDRPPLAQYPGAPFEDRDGNLWFATVLEGVIRYDGTNFVNFTQADGLGSNGVRDIVQDKDGLLWFATTKGVSTYNGEQFKTLTDYGEIDIVRTFGENPDHLDIWDLHFAQDGRLWITTLGGVFRYEGSQFAPFPLSVVATSPNYEFSPKMVYGIYEDPAGGLWFGTDGAGAVHLTGETQTVYTEKSHGLCSNRVCTVLRDSRGDLWFGTSSGGVSRYDGTTFTTHLRSTTYSKHTGWGRYMSILEDSQGCVWFGVSSQGGGVHRFDGKEFRYFSEAEGLGTGGVPSLSLDRSGRLWLGTTSGTYLFDGERFTHFTRDR